MANGYVLVGVSVGAVLFAAAIWWTFHRYNKKIAVRRDIESFTQPVAKIKNLWIYPLKATHRYELEQADCLIWGLKNDRYWMIYNESIKRHVNQKTIPELATITSRIREDDNGRVSLILDAPGMEALTIHQPDHPIVDIVINNVEGQGIDAGDGAAEWLTRFTGKTGNRIYYMSPGVKHRHIMQYHDIGAYCGPHDQTCFADFGPVFIISQSSLDDLNDRLDHHVSMTRFRPNIVIEGCSPYSEDKWSEIRIGDSCILKKLVEGQRYFI
jgi:uncharacterized protein YcbX